VLDFDTLVFGPVYDVFGQPAVLTINSGQFDVVVIDHTRGITVEESGMAGVQTVRPAADVRRSLLVRQGIAVKDLLDGDLRFEGVSWQIKSFLDNGDELRLILMAIDDDDNLPAYLLTEIGSVG
jgi:hypothetical protein